MNQKYIDIMNDAANKHERRLAKNAKLRAKIDRRKQGKAFVSPYAVQAQRETLKLCMSIYNHAKVRLAVANKQGKAYAGNKGQLMSDCKKAKLELRRNAYMLHAFLLMRGMTSAPLPANAQ